MRTCWYLLSMYFKLRLPRPVQALLLDTEPSFVRPQLWRLNTKCRIITCGGKCNVLVRWNAVVTPSPSSSRAPQSSSAGPGQRQQCHARDRTRLCSCAAARLRRSHFWPGLRSPNKCRKPHQPHQPSLLPTMACRSLAYFGAWGKGCQDK